MRPGREGQGHTSPMDGAEPEAWTTEGGSKSLRKLGLQAEAAAGAKAPGQGWAGVGSAGGDPQTTGRAATPGLRACERPTCDRGRSVSAGTGVPCAEPDPVVADLLPHVPRRAGLRCLGQRQEGLREALRGQSRTGQKQVPLLEVKQGRQCPLAGCGEDGVTAEGCDFQGSPLRPPAPHLGMSPGSPSSPSLLCPSMSHEAQEGVSTVVTEAPGPQQRGCARGPSAARAGGGRVRAPGLALGSDSASLRLCSLSPEVQAGEHLGAV